MLAGGNGIGRRADQLHLLKAQKLMLAVHRGAGALDPGQGLDDFEGDPFIADGEVLKRPLGLGPQSASDATSMPPRLSVSILNGCVIRASARSSVESIIRDHLPSDVPSFRINRFLVVRCRFTVPMASLFRCPMHPWLSCRDTSRSLAAR